MKHVCVSLVILFSMIGIARVFAGVVPGQWEKVATTEPGAAIVVFLKSGDRIEGTFEQVGEQDVIIVAGQRERHYPKPEVEKIETAPYTDSRADGTLTGAALGALSAGVLAALVSANLDTAENPGAAAAFGAALGAGIGAGIGFAVDASNKGSDLLYRAE